MMICGYSWYWPDPPLKPLIPYLVDLYHDEIWLRELLAKGRIQLGSSVIRLIRKTVKATTPRGRSIHGGRRK
ncbi:MAG TPA: hypothetical protein ENI27_03905 [bacterium]|nr:hypothetical protein [bacterium]